ncbi:MAG: hypothetical protein Q8O14_10260 [bacterium]|jgi:hypothetical protein|nr:hypothetical protein [bacterium]
MLELPIPGRRDLQLRHLVLDFNGTLAAADLVGPGPREALDLLLVPARRRATLRLA